MRNKAKKSHLCGDPPSLPLSPFSPPSSPLPSFLFFYFTGLSVLPKCLSADHVYAWCPWKSEEDIGPSGTGIRKLISQHVDAENWTRVPLEEQPALNPWVGAPFSQCYPFKRPLVFLFEKKNNNFISYAFSKPTWSSIRSFKIFCSKL